VAGRGYIPHLRRPRGVWGASDAGGSVSMGGCSFLVTTIAMAAELRRQVLCMDGVATTEAGGPRPSGLASWAGSLSCRFMYGRPSRPHGGRPPWPRPGWSPSRLQRRSAGRPSRPVSCAASAASCPSDPGGGRRGGKTLSVLLSWSIQVNACAGVGARNGTGGSAACGAKILAL